MIKQIVMKNLLCAEHCVRYWDYRDKRGQWLLVSQNLQFSEEYRQVNPLVPCNIVTAVKERRDTQGVMASGKVPRHLI